MKKFFCITLFALFSSTAVVANTPDEDILFNVLKREVGYYYSQLSQDSLPVRFISLNVLNENRVNIFSDTGAALVTEANSRRLKPNIWFDKDNPSKIKNRSDKYDLPFSDDTIAIKEVIWDALDKEYQSVKDARKSEAKKEKKDTLKSSIAFKAEQHYESPLPPLNIDKERWKALLNRVTSVRKEGVSAICTANFICEQHRKYLVSSEGTEIVQNRRSFIINLNVKVKDKKEDISALNKVFFAHNEGELPSEEELKNAITDLIDRADALSKAPLAEAYTGPVLFSGDASGVFFHEVLGHRLEKEDSEFKTMMETRVLPEGFSISCDPTLDNFDGTPIHGGYLFDDEGTKAQKVECIKDGILKSMLRGRWSEKGETESNGHSRAAFGEKASPRQSNFFVETSHPYTEEQLRGMLIQELKNKNKEYGYYIRTVSNGWTTTGTNTNRISSFNVVPIETYRIYADGRPDSLVRGVSFIGTPLTAFSNVKAAGGRYEVSNGRCGSRSGWIPVSLISPMLYVSQMETQCLKTDEEEAPKLSPPEFVPKEQLEGLSDDSVIFKAMADEMTRSMDSLKSDDGMKPYFLDYRIFRTGNAYIHSSLGTCNYLNVNEIKNSGKVIVVVGDSLKTSYNDGLINELPDEVSYNHIRRELWGCTNAKFNSVCDDHKSNDTWRAQEFLDDSIPEWTKIPGRVYTEKSALANYQKDVETLKALADTLSAIFKNYPQLCRTRVGIDFEYEDIYQLNSDGLHARTPLKKVNITSNASFLSPEGELFEEITSFTYYDVDDLPPTDSLMAELERFANKVMRKKAVTLSEELEYIGPVIYENGKALQALYNNLYGQTNIRDYIICSLNWRNRKYDNTYRLLGKKVVCKNISVWQLGNDSVYNGHRMLGYRKYDADGVRPATIELIRKGILMNQLAGRRPSPVTRKSTGNQRMNGSRDYGWYASGTVLRISFDKTMSRKKLIKKLIAMAREQHSEYAYIISDWQGMLRINTKTGEQEEVWLRNGDNPSRLQLMGDIWASKEETADRKESVIHPKTILFPLVELRINASTPRKCERFAKLRH